MWNEISNEKDLNRFLTEYDNFHDCCIKELKYISGAYVNDNFSMNAVNNTRKLSIIFQRQCKINPVVEIEFLKLETLHLCPVSETYTCEMLDIAMFFDNNKLYWGDSEDFMTEKHLYDGTWLCAEKARWRYAEEYIGCKEIYVGT